MPASGPTPEGEQRMAIITIPGTDPATTDRGEPDTDVYDADMVGIDVCDADDRRVGFGDEDYDFD